MARQTARTLTTHRAPPPPEPETEKPVDKITKQKKLASPDDVKEYRRMRDGLRKLMRVTKAREEEIRAKIIAELIGEIGVKGADKQPMTEKEMRTAKKAAYARISTAAPDYAAQVAAEK